MRSEEKARCEMMMMGFTEPIRSKEHLEEVVRYSEKAMGTDIPVEDVMEQLFKYTVEGTIPKHAVFNRIMGMRCLTVTLQAPKEKYDILSEDGVFSSVYNFDAPDCSELGYTFFENRFGAIKRIG